MAECAEPILQLVYRTYTDQQYEGSKVKELSQDIVEYL